jgi:transcriptional regulator with XRE-family HTH domain
MDDATLGDRIRAVRMRRGLTQKELTAASGVSVARKVPGQPNSGRPAVPEKTSQDIGADEA